MLAPFPLKVEVIGTHEVSQESVTLCDLPRQEAGAGPIQAGALFLPKCLGGDVRSQCRSQNAEQILVGVEDVTISVVKMCAILVPFQDDDRMTTQSVSDLYVR